MLKMIVKMLAVLSVSAAVGISQSMAQNNDELSRFFLDVKTFKADFSQVVTDENGDVLEQSEGVFILGRPGKFSWVYAKPLPQKIISNGKTVWLYDEDLEQVTLRNYQTALNGSPAELLAGTMSIIDFYDVIRTNVSNTLVNYQLIPKEIDSQFNRIEINFENGDLSTLSLKDSFLRETTLKFFNRNINPTIDSKLFEFVIPEGVDVIQDNE